MDSSYTTTATATATATTNMSQQQSPSKRGGGGGGGGSGGGQAGSGSAQGAGSKDIASAMISYQRKQSRAARANASTGGADSSSEPPLDPANSHPQSRSRSGRGRQRSGHSDRASAAGGSGTGGGSGSGADREPSSSSLRIIQHGPASANSGHGSGRLQPQRLTQTELEALAEESPHHQPPHHPHHHHHNHHSHHHHQQRQNQGSGSAGGGKHSSNSMHRGPSSGGQNDTSSRKNGGSGAGGRHPSSPSLLHAPSGSMYSGTGGGNSSVFSTAAHTHNNNGVGTGSSTVTSVVGTGTNNTDQTRTLFDPRRHDPVKFAMSKRLPGVLSLSQPHSAASSNASGHAHPAQHHNLQHQAHHRLANGGLDSGVDSAAAAGHGHLVGGASPSATSSDASRERRRRRAPSSRSNATGGGGGALAGSEASRSDSNAGSELSGTGTGTGTSSRPGGESAAGAGAGGGTGGNAYLSDIATTYQVIARLETQLKEQHATAAAAGSSLGLLGPNGTSSSSSGPAVISGGSDGGKSKGIVQRNANGNANTNAGATQLTTLDISAAKAVDDGVDHAFWTSLATQHKHLAELNAAFMEMCWRPYIPSSFAGLPLKYNTPARLWQNAFHMFLERLRHALPFPSPSSPPPKGDRRGAARQAALLDHLEEFIYFAYAYYSNLHEAETFLRFRMAWIECLGDLARYRMAVAGFRMGLAAWEVGEKEGVVVGRGEATAVGDGPFGGQVLGRIDDDDAGSADEVSREQGRAAAAGAVHRVMEAPSIGEAALGDWDLEEKETWRETARGWYAKGLAEMPGTGRLHHHLGILSRGKEELKGLYHFAKSLTSSKPYPPARETMGPMCDREHQLRRVQPGASATDLFIHLHAMLFTRIDLDNFEDVFARYKEAIKTALAVGPAGVGAINGSQAGAGSAGRAFSRHGSLPVSDGSELLGEGLMSEATWMIYGTVCIAGLLQYGATDALLSAPPVEHTTSDRKDAHRGSKGKITQKVKSQTPTAIMINKDSPSTSTAAAAAAASSGQSPLRNGVALPNQQEDDGDAGDEVDGETELDGDEDGRLAEPHEDNIVSLQQPAFDPTSIPLTFSYAARVAFDTLEIVIQHGVLSRSGGGTSQKTQSGSAGGGGPSSASSSTTTTTDVPNPYITMLLTFLLTILKQAHTPVILERWVPWQALTELANSGPDAGNSSNSSLIPPGAALAEIPSKVTSGMPLPEDWCLRGMYWTTRRVFERGFWKARGGVGLPAFESEVEVLDRLDGFGGNGGGAEDERDSGEHFVGAKGAVPVGSQHGLAHGSASGGGGGGDSESGHGTFAQLRWSRIGYAIGSLARTVPGLDARQSKKNGKSTLVIVAPLATKILEWKAEEESVRAEENSRRVRTLFEDDEEDEVGEAWEEDSDEEASSDGENDESVSEAVRALKARRRALKQALKDAKKNPSTLSRPRVNRSPSKRGQRKGAGAPTVAAAKPPGVSLDALPGYTILVLDTNIIVSPAGNLLRTLVESKKWTVVLPLAVITELDGLSKNRNQVGDGAKAALKYIEQSLPTHGKWLKVQTSRGNYLYNLNIRFEHIDFAGLHLQNGDDVASSSTVDAQQRKTLQARNLDEIILRAAIWQEDHFVSRIPILFAQSASDREAASARVTPNTTKVVLITLDRNLRLKARARGIKAASDVELLDVVVGRDARPNG